MRAGRNLRPDDVRKETDALGQESFLRASFGACRRNAENAALRLAGHVLQASKRRITHGRYVKWFGFPQAAATFSLVVGLIGLTGLPLLATNKPFSVPDDIAVRIRLDDTLTSTDSQIGDPFSATVVDKGDYQNARVYGHVAQIDMSGKIKGHTSMMLRFDRLVMPDGRRAQIHAEIIELYHAPSGEKVDVEGAIESGGRGRKTIAHTAIGAGAGALLGGIFGGGKGAGIGSIIGGAGGLGTTAFHGRQKISLNSGQEMLIRITGG
jgi:uncharacterized protein YcfJ